jgi:transcription elongation factor Elf1
MKIKISATFEGTCNICKKKKTVFTAGDEDTKKVVSICKNCAENLGDIPTSDAVEKYGVVDDKPFEKGVKVEQKAKAG